MLLLLGSSVLIVPGTQTTSVAKLVAEAWRELSAEDRGVWDERARRDKVRYQAEKAVYKGPWQVPNQRRQKDPLAPKRPMSAFLAFSNSRRALIKKSNQTAANADISKALSNMWKEAPEELRQKYFSEEAGLRQDYKIRIEEWRKNAAKEEKEKRKQREDLALRKAEENDGGLPTGSSTTVKDASSSSVAHASAAMATSQQSDNATSTAMAQFQQQLQLNKMRQALMQNPFVSSNSFGIQSNPLGLHTDLRASVPSLNVSLGPFGGFYNLNNLNFQDRAQLSLISGTYQTIFPPAIGMYSYRRNYRWYLYRPSPSCAKCLGTAVSYPLDFA
jgi:hypothetical protein